MTLTEFLLARISEDEEWAMTSSSTSTPGSFTRDNYGALLIQPTRVMAECEAKRAILAAHEAHEERVRFALAMGLSPDHADQRRNATREILRLLALPYADHPDYLPEWKP